MSSTAQYWQAWHGEDNTFPLPIEQWKQEFPAPAFVYPDFDFIPTDVSYVFTSFLEGDMELYSPITLQSHPEDDDGDISTLLIGVVPDNDGLLFLFNTGNGEVWMLDLDAGIPELVNSSLRKFLDFLYHFTVFVEQDHGPEGRATQAGALHTRLQNIDPDAFADPESWWSLAFAELESV